MRPTTLARSALMLAILATATPGQAQTADDGSMRVVGYADDRVMMVTGVPPVATPRAPVEVWSWTFYRDVRGEGETASDTLAARYRIDCATSTLSPLYAEAYRDGRYVFGQTSTLAPFVAQEGTIVALLLSATCVPGFNPEAEVFPDAVVGRAGALAALSRLR